MRIAIIGFGSLVNNPYSQNYNKELKARKPNASVSIPQDTTIKPDSPFLPAENLKLPLRLARISSMGTQERRITMTLFPGASHESVFFTESKFANLNDAIKNLREREGIPASNYESIGYVNLINGASRSRMEDVANRIREWAMQNGFEGVIWTDLPPKGIEFAQGSTGREILPFLENDSVLLRNTKNYILDLPKLPNPLQQRVLNMPEVEVSANSMPIASQNQEAYQASLTADFAERDNMPQTDVPQEHWFDRSFDLWGPLAKQFPAPIVPNGIDPIQWKRDRIIEAAKHYQGLPYKRWEDGCRGHFPARGCGLDCSNFAAWVYNYGLGIKFTSDVDALANGASPAAGRVLASNEPLKKGDLILLNGRVKHVVIYIDENHVIDSTSIRPEGVQVRDVREPHNKWCRPHNNPHFICARRPIE